VFRTFQNIRNELRRNYTEKVNPASRTQL